MDENNHPDLDRLISRIKDLPTLPTVLDKIVTLTSDPDVNISEIEKAISTDPVISTKLLRIVNSAYFSFFREITSLRQAIVVLGMEATKNLVYGTSIVSLFGRESKIKLFPLEGFWKYSVASGNVSRTLASLLDYAFYEEAFLAGLIHDIGKIVLANYMPDEFERALVKAQEWSVPLAQAEREEFGFDHNVVGHQLAARWRLPQMLDEVISFHDDPEQAEEFKELTSLVRLAAMLCHTNGIGVSGEPPLDWEMQQDVAWRVLSQENELLNTVDFEHFSMTLSEEVEKVEAFVEAIYLIPRK